MCTQHDLLHNADNRMPIATAATTTARFPNKPGAAGAPPHARHCSNAHGHQTRACPAFKGLPPAPSVISNRQRCPGKFAASGEAHAVSSRAHATTLRHNEAANAIHSKTKTSTPPRNLGSLYNHEKSPQLSAATLRANAVSCEGMRATRACIWAATRQVYYLLHPNITQQALLP